MLLSARDILAWAGIPRTRRTLLAIVIVMAAGASVWVKWVNPHISRISRTADAVHFVQQNLSSIQKRADWHHEWLSGQSNRLAELERKVSAITSEDLLTINSALEANRHDFALILAWIYEIRSRVERNQLELTEVHVELFGTPRPKRQQGVTILQSP